MPRWFSFTIILLLGIYTLLLQSKDQLILYINPRYLISATIAASICVVIGSLGYLWLVVKYKRGLLKRAKDSLFDILRSVNLRNPKAIAILTAAIFSLFTPLGFVLLVLVIVVPFSDKERLLHKQVLIEFLVTGIIAVGFILPAQTLSSQTASQRATSLNTATFTNEISATSLFSFSSDKYDVGDWIRRINVNPNLSEYVGKKVNVTGFVFRPEDYPDDMFLASRFLISCCAVDARPIGLPVKFSNWNKQFTSDDWVHVSGEFALSKINDQDVLVIVPDGVPEKTMQPARPYIY